MTPNALLGLVIALLVTVGLPALVLYLIHRYSRVPTAVPLYGGLFCLLSMALSIPLGYYVWPLVFGARSAVGTVVASAVTVGVLEELARYASFRWLKTMRDHRDHAGALAAGFGHGAVGSVLTGLQMVAGIGIMLVLPGKFGLPALQQILVYGGPQFVLQALRQLPLIACSLALSTLVVLAFRRSIGFLFVAITAHVTVLLLNALLGYLWGEAVLSLAGGLSLLFVALVIRSRVIAPHYPAEPDEHTTQPDRVPSG